MADYTIYAIKGDPDWRSKIFESLRQGEGRFGWSGRNATDLHQLQDKVATTGWDSLSSEEKDCYQGFLLEIKAGDYVVYVNVPEWGKCTAARITGPYHWKLDDEDFNHRFSVDKDSVLTFDRNDAVVPPALSARLKLQGRYWRVKARKEFEDLVQALKEGRAGKARTPADNLALLAKEIRPLLRDITRTIHRTHPNYDLENLVANVFEKVPGVIAVKQKGGAGDHGADVLVTFDSGPPLLGLQQQRTCVVQVKSFEGAHWDVKAAQDIRRAFQHYPEAEMGIIISTADSSTPALDQELDRTREETGKPVSLLIGEDLAAFFLRFGSELTSSHMGA
jgi:hypothetical protein